MLDYRVLSIGTAVSLVLSVWFKRRRRLTARCIIEANHSKGVCGFILLDESECGTLTHATCHLSGLTPGLHGLHVHRCNDLSKGCASLCDHYNPTGAVHGGARGSNRHRGDFGNIHADALGRCTTRITAEVTLVEILNRSFVIHADADDLGTGGNDESLRTGNAGERVACGIILPG